MWPCLGSTYSPYCSFCSKYINQSKEYAFYLSGPGKHDQKTICKNCLTIKLLK